MVLSEREKDLIERLRGTDLIEGDLIGVIERLVTAWHRVPPQRTHAADERAAWKKEQARMAAVTAKLRQERKERDRHFADLAARGECACEEEEMGDTGEDSAMRHGHGDGFTPLYYRDPHPHRCPRHHVVDGCVTCNSIDVGGQDWHRAALIAVYRQYAERYLERIVAIAEGADIGWDPQLDEGDARGAA